MFRPMMSQCQMRISASDDSLFKLTRAPAKDCLPLAGEDEDKAALKKMP